MPNLGKILGVYKVAVKATAQGTDNIEIEGPKVQAGQIAEIHHASLVDYTTKNKNQTIGFKKADGTIHYLKVRQGTNLNSVWINGSWCLLPGEAPYGVIESPGDGDVCYGTFSGVIYEFPGK